jgi:hypothetical protein
MIRRAALSFTASASALAAGCGRIDFDPLASAGDAAQSDSTDAASAIRFVRSTGLQQTNDVGNTVTATFGAPPTVGNTLVAYTWAYAFGGQTDFPMLNGISDTAGNTWTLAVDLRTTATGCDGNGSSAVAIYVAPAIPATTASYAVTVTPLGPSPQELALAVVEYTGVTAIDQSTSLLTAGSPSPMTFDSGTTAMTTANDELLASVASSCSGNPGTVSWVDNAGFMMRGEEIHTNVNEPGWVGDKIVTGTGTYSDSWTITFPSGGPFPALAAIATLR